MTRNDPLRGFRFQLEIEGINSGAFARVKGLSREVSHESFREGGVNDYEHKLVTQVSFPVLVLERGLIMHDLWAWTQSTADGKVKRRNVRIVLNNEENQPRFAWKIEGAIPVKWSASDLDAGSSQVVMESLELAHHGMRKAAI